MVAYSNIAVNNYLAHKKVRVILGQYLKPEQVLLEST